MRKPRPDIELGYHGPAAEGFADGGRPDRGDVLDLFEPELWRNPTSSKASMLRGTAICAIAACTGATLNEALRMRRSAFMTEGHATVTLGGNNVNMHARTMPLIRLAQDILTTYDEAAHRAADCTAFFTDDSGNAARDGAVLEQFRCMGERIGVHGFTLPARLRGWFIACLDEVENQTARYHIAGWHVRQRLDRDDITEPPSLAAMRAILERHHPLGRPDREMLRRRGAVARAFPHPHFPTLSREAQSVLAQRRAGSTRYYPAELHTAIDAARASGKRTEEIAEHYGIDLQWAQRHHKFGASYQPLAGRELKALKAYAVSTDRPTARGAQIALLAAGRTMILQQARYWAKKHGVELIDDRKLPYSDVELGAVGTYAGSAERPTARGVQKVLASIGRTVLLKQVRDLAKAQGLVLVHERRLHLTDEEIAVVRGYAASTEAPTARGVKKALTAVGRELPLKHVRVLARRHGVTLVNETRLRLNEPETEALRAYAASNPRPTSRGLTAALAAAGRELTLCQVHSLATTHGMALVNDHALRLTDSEIAAMRGYVASNTTPTVPGLRAALAVAGRDVTMNQARSAARRYGAALVNARLVHPDDARTLEAYMASTERPTARGLLAAFAAAGRPRKLPTVRYLARRLDAKLSSEKGRRPTVVDSSDRAVVGP